jgi:hypothetical protein
MRDAQRIGGTHTYRGGGLSTKKRALDRFHAIERSLDDLTSDSGTKPRELIYQDIAASSSAGSAISTNFTIE